MDGPPHMRGGRITVPGMEMDQLRQQLADGVPLDRDAFLHNMALLLPSADPDAISQWADFAQESVDMGQYVDFVEEPEPVALNRWHDSMLAGFVLLAEQFSEETAAQVCGLSLNHCTLYPYELECAAQEVQKGTDLDGIFNLMFEGHLEAPEPVFPKLKEVLAHEPGQKPQPEMLL